MAADDLPSWRDGPAKSAIVDFVARVTKEGGADFVPPAARIAVFDNDGTLWCEQPLQNQFFFARARLEALAEQDPSMRERQPFKAFLEHDLKTIELLGKEGVFAIALSTHAGMTAEAFDQIARDWLGSAKHPKLGRLFTQCVYAPQIELLQYLRQSGFTTFIVSGGGVDFMRAFAAETYGIPPHQVIGSNVKTRVEIDGRRADLVKLADLGSFDDREEKVVNIGLHIGQRPILAFGNSDGDLAMLRYTLAGEGLRLGLLLHHDDAEREFAYDREFRLSPLAEALDRAADYEITVVSMKQAWDAVFVANA